MEQVIGIFNTNKIRYLVIGGQAIRLEGMPRYTMDWDFFIPRNDSDNLRKINDLLEGDLDMPVASLGPRGENFVQTYQTRWGIIQFHLAPVGLPSFDDAEKRSVIHQDGAGTEVRCICGEDLLTCKQAVCRDKDKDDIKFLELKKASGTLSRPTTS